MPYTIRKKGSKFCVYNTETGENKGCSDDMETAVAHRNVLYGVDKGWKPTGKKRKS